MKHTKGEMGMTWFNLILLTSTCSYSPHHSFIICYSPGLPLILNAILDATHFITDPSEEYE